MQALNKEYAKDHRELNSWDYQDVDDERSS
jgi:hypothetical protein